MFRRRSRLFYQRKDWRVERFWCVRAFVRSEVGLERSLADLDLNSLEKETTIMISTLTILVCAVVGILAGVFAAKSFSNKGVWYGFKWYPDGEPLPTTPPSNAKGEPQYIRGVLGSLVCVSALSLISFQAYEEFTGGSGGTILPAMKAAKKSKAADTTLFGKLVEKARRIDGLTSSDYPKLNPSTDPYSITFGSEWFLPTTMEDARKEAERTLNKGKNKKLKVKVETIKKITPMSTDGNVISGIRVVYAGSVVKVEGGKEECVKKLPHNAILCLPPRELATPEGTAKWLEGVSAEMDAMVDPAEGSVYSVRPVLRFVPSLDNIVPATDDE